MQYKCNKAEKGLSVQPSLVQYDNELQSFSYHKLSATPA